MKENTREKIKEKICDIFFRGFSKVDDEMNLLAAERKARKILKGLNLNLFKIDNKIADNLIDVFIEKKLVVNIYVFSVYAILCNFMKKTKRTDTTVTEIMERYNISETAREDLNCCLRTLREMNIIRCDLCAGLDNIFIFKTLYVRVKVERKICLKLSW